jgi:hypothetical protein
MSRLLHAAARGARIQGRWIDDTPQWHTVRKVYLVEDLPYQRIHPEDAHLAYGPLSTALREIGLTGTCDDVDIPYVKPALLWEDGFWESTEEQRRVFCLILAEALADSGL